MLEPCAHGRGATSVVAGERKHPRCDWGAHSAALSWWLHESGEIDFVFVVVSSMEEEVAGGAAAAGGEAGADSAAAADGGVPMVAMATTDAATPHEGSSAHVSEAGDGRLPGSSLPVARGRPTEGAVPAATAGAAANGGADAAAEMRIRQLEAELAAARKLLEEKNSGANSGGGESPARPPGSVSSGDGSLAAAAASPSSSSSTAEVTVERSASRAADDTALVSASGSKYGAATPPARAAHVVLRLAPMSVIAADPDEFLEERGEHCYLCRAEGDPAVVCRACGKSFHAECATVTRGRMYFTVACGLCHENLEGTVGKYIEDTRHCAAQTLLFLRSWARLMDGKEDTSTTADPTLDRQARIKQDAELAQKTAAVLVQSTDSHGYGRKMLREFATGLTRPVIGFSMVLDALRLLQRPDAQQMPALRTTRRSLVTSLWRVLEYGLEPGAKLKPDRRKYWREHAAWAALVTLADGYHEDAFRLLNLSLNNFTPTRKEVAVRTKDTAEFLTLAIRDEVGVDCLTTKDAGVMLSRSLADLKQAKQFDRAVIIFTGLYERIGRQAIVDSFGSNGGWRSLARSLCDANDLLASATNSLGWYRRVAVQMLVARTRARSATRQQRPSTGSDSGESDAILSSAGSHDGSEPTDGAIEELAAKAGAGAGGSGGVDAMLKPTVAARKRAREEEGTEHAAGGAGSGGNGPPSAKVARASSEKPAIEEERVCYLCSFGGDVGARCSTCNKSYHHACAAVGDAQEGAVVPIEECSLCTEELRGNVGRIVAEVRDRTVQALYNVRIQRFPAAAKHARKVRSLVSTKRDEQLVSVAALLMRPKLGFTLLVDTVRVVQEMVATTVKKRGGVVAHSAPVVEALVDALAKVLRLASDVAIGAERAKWWMDQAAKLAFSTLTGAWSKSSLTLLGASLGATAVSDKTLLTFGIVDDAALHRVTNDDALTCLAEGLASPRANDKSNFDHALRILYSAVEYRSGAGASKIRAHDGVMSQLTAALDALKQPKSTLAWYRRVVLSEVLAILS